MDSDANRHVIVLSDRAWEWLLECARSAGLLYKGRPSRTAWIEELARGSDIGTRVVREECVEKEKEAVELLHIEHEPYYD